MRIRLGALNHQFLSLFFLSVLFISGSVSPAQSQTPPVTLTVLNQGNAAGEIVVIQGQPVEVEFMINDPSGLDKKDTIQLVSTADGTVIHSKNRGNSLNGSVSLLTNTSPAPLTLRAEYVTLAGSLVATAPEEVQVVADVSSLELQQQIAALNTMVAQLQVGLAAEVLARQTANATQDTAITALQTSVSTNTSGVATNITGVGTNATAIGTLQTDVGAIQTANATQDTSIAALQTSVSTNTSGVATNTSGVGDNATAIGTLQTSVGTNTSGVGDNATAIGTLQTSVGTNTSGVATNTSGVGNNATAIGTLTTDVGSVISLSALAPYISVDPNPINGLNGPHILFTGANLHIQSGSSAGATDDGGSLTGLGNLIVGYNETPFGGTTTHRGGSHNIVVGTEHRYEGFGSFVGGFRNWVTGEMVSVLGGTSNTAENKHSTVSGGGSNKASGEMASVSGGRGNQASGLGSSVSGGWSNKATFNQSTVSGGTGNISQGQQSTVGGGSSITLGVGHSWVAGTLNQDSGTVIGNNSLGLTTAQADIGQLQIDVTGVQTVNTTQDTAITALQTAGGGPTQAEFDTLTGVVTTNTGDITTLATDVGDVQGLVDLAPFVSVDNAVLNGVVGPHIIFEGANVHVRNVTDNNDGLGNLIVGHNSEPQDSAGLLGGERSGSNNLVVGTEHRYTRNGGFVAGWRNTILGIFATVSGGRENTANGSYSSVSGGISGTASGPFSSVGGGFNNTASGNNASVSGGNGNTASAFSGSVSGGLANEAIGIYSSVSGGISNDATGDRSSISGGNTNHAVGTDTSVLGGNNNTAKGNEASVVGGSNNRAEGPYSSVLGGAFQTVPNTNTGATSLGGLDCITFPPVNFGVNYGKAQGGCITFLPIND